jgi:hypothetical protein
MDRTSLLSPWPLGQISRRPKHLEESSRPPRNARQHAIEGCKIVTTDHASTLFEMQRRLVPQGRPGASLACPVSQGIIPPPISTHPSIALHDGSVKCSHAQTPKARGRLLSASYPLVQDPSLLTPNGTQRTPSSPPEMRASTNGLDYQTFLRRWNLADPTTAAEPGFRAPTPKRRVREI